MSAPLGWARPWAIARPFSRPTPRAGAWYPIIGEADGQRVVLEIRGRKVAVMRKLVEIRDDLPDRFTVVYKSTDEKNPARGSGRDLGTRYAVCPQCGARQPIFHDPHLLICTVCTHRGEVAYWETG
jgi:hypothetical protein